jgi:acylphosphatase
MNMNIWKNIRVSAAALMVCTVIHGVTQAQESGPKPVPLREDPAFVDIDSFFDTQALRPEVNVNLPQFLLRNMVSELNGGKEDPFAEMGINIAELTKDIRLVRVMVLESRGDREKQKLISSSMDKLRQSLRSGWIPVVNVPDGNVSVYAMGDDTASRMMGLAITVSEGGSAVVVNVVGEIPIGKIIGIAGRVAGEGEGRNRIQEALKQLMGNAGPPPAAEAPDTDKKESAKE